MDVELDLRAVEGALAGQELEGQARVAQAGLEGRFRAVPGRVVADALLGAGGELHLHLAELQHLVDFIQELDELLDLAGHLILGAEDVGVVLRERAHARQAVHRAAPLVAVQTGEVGHAPGQLAVGALARAEDHAVAGAIHGLEHEGVVLELALHAVVVVALLELVLGPHAVHVLVVVAEVAAGAEHLGIVGEGGDHLVVLVAVVKLADELHEAVVDESTLRQEEGHGRRHLVEHEEVELLAELAVVALGGLFQPGHVGLEVLGRPVGGGVDALEHLVLLVAAPVRAGHRQELEVLDQVGVGHVGATAQVAPVALAVNGDGRVGVLREDILENLGLVGLALAAELGSQRADLAGRHHAAVHVELGLGEALHLFFDLLEVFGGEGALVVEVVEEAGIGDGADGDHRALEEVLDGVGHQVGGAVAQDLQRVGVVGGDDLDRVSVLEGPRAVHQLTVHPAGHGFFRQAPADRLGQSEDGGASRNLTAGTIREDHADRGSIDRRHNQSPCRKNGVKRSHFNPQAAPCQVRSSSSASNSSSNSSSSSSPAWCT
ncbi:hypothetical protein D3C72_1007440 [compost metagenome]